MLSKDDRSAISALQWYFAVLLSKTTSPEEDINHSIKLGSLIKGLNNYGELICLCALANKDNGLTPEKEFEYVGRGFIDPFYRLTHNNEDCSQFIFHSLETIRNIRFQEQGMKALIVLVFLILTQQFRHLGFDSLIPASLAIQLGDRGFIADKTLEERINLLPLSTEALNDLYATLDNKLKAKSLPANHQTLFYTKKQKPSTSQQVSNKPLPQIVIKTTITEYYVPDVKAHPHQPKNHKPNTKSNSQQRGQQHSDNCVIF